MLISFKNEMKHSDIPKDIACFIHLLPNVFDQLEKSDEGKIVQQEFLNLAITVRTLTYALTDPSKNPLPKDKDKEPEHNLVDKLTSLDIKETKIKNVVFFAVGMRFRGNHMFSSEDEILLEKENDNPHDNNAIKILVKNKKYEGESTVASYKHAAYVTRNDAIELRKINDFEKYKVEFRKRFAASAEMVLKIE